MPLFLRDRMAVVAAPVFAPLALVDGIEWVLLQIVTFD